MKNTSVFNCSKFLSTSRNTDISAISISWKGFISFIPVFDRNAIAKTNCFYLVILKPLGALSSYQKTLILFFVAVSGVKGYSL